MSVSTLVAIATPPGQGGVGVVRISGPKSKSIHQAMVQAAHCRPRQAEYARFVDATGEVLDEGLSLWFPGPHSFTGEDVLELQGHGGPVVLSRLVDRALALGAKLAPPGAFSKRAFLNGKLDLTQAEAIADLIAANSEQAARAAGRSLQGVFSEQVQALVAEVTQLRVFVEAAIDFPEEEIDFLADDQVHSRFNGIKSRLECLLQAAQGGLVLTEGVQGVILGRPNVGKSSLLNALCGQDRAIVTDVPGTTRDLLSAQLTLDGIVFNLTDMAGIRDTQDPVEQIGVARARTALAQADLVIVMVEAGQATDFETEIKNLIGTPLSASQKCLLIENKIDLLKGAPAQHKHPLGPHLQVSLKANQGLDLIRSALKTLLLGEQLNEDCFSVRRRQMSALKKSQVQLQKAALVLQQNSGELFAEDLRCVQNLLSEITGEFSSDDLLGEIFSSFCVGK